MKTIQLIVVLVVLALTFCACQKKYTTAQDRANLSENNLRYRLNEVTAWEAGLANKENRSNTWEQQMLYFKSTNNDLLARLSDFSVVSKSGAESIKQSLCVASTLQLGLHSKIQIRDVLY